MRSHAKASSAGSTVGAGKLAGLLALAIGALLAIGASPASAAPPTLAVDSSASSITYTSAHVSGAVNPEGGGPFAFVSWALQYTTEPAEPFSWIPGPSGSITGAEAEGSSPIAVAGELTGLQPGTEYSVRLVAENFEDPQAVSPEPNLAFTTTATSAPQILSTHAATSAGEATLEASVKPNGLATDYRFEWGPTESYGRSSANKTIPASGEDVSVSAGLLGLSPNTTYHYRLLTSNGDGEAQSDDETFTTQAPAGPESCPNAVVRAQQNSTYLANCRAYEQVSPADKNGYPVFFSAHNQVAQGMTRSSTDGNAAVYASYGSFAGSTSGMPRTYRSQRTSAGWTATPVSPLSGTSTPSALTTVSQWGVSTPDLTTGVLGVSLGYGVKDFFDPTDTNEAEDIYTQPAGGNPVLASRGNGSERVLLGELGAGIMGLSDDGSTVAFKTDSHLVPEDADRLYGVDTYVRSHGHTDLVNTAAGGGLISQCGSRLGSDIGGALSTAISSDGSHVVFQTGSNGFPVEFGMPDCEAPSQVYVRVDATETLHASASQRTPIDPAGTQSANFVGASTDGSDVFLASLEMLTDNAPAGGGVYEFHPADGSLEFVKGTDLSVSPIGAIVRISDDGSHVFFVSNHEVDGEGTEGSDNLYLNVDGDVRWITTVAAGDMRDASRASDLDRIAYATPSGSALVFASRAQLTDYDNSGCLNGGVPDACQEIYLYRAGTPGVTCVSCDPAGQRPAGSAPRTDAFLSDAVGGEAVMGDDGSAVFFTAADQLVAADTNHWRDVYEYSGGRVHLVSSGRSSGASFLVGASSDGATVFFTTSDVLVPGDTDGGNVDLYAARVDGGFSETGQTPTPPCLGDSCQSSLNAPAHPVAGSESFAGPANPKHHKKVKKQHRKAKPHKKKHHRKAHKKQRAGAKRGGSK